MTTAGFTYATYAIAGLGAFATFVALPREGRSRRAPALIMGIAAVIGLTTLAASRFGGTAGQNAVLGFLALISLGGAVRVITHPQPVYSALYFVMVALSSAALAIMSGAEFLGAALVIVYAGAILVTYVFVIMLAHQSRDPKKEPRGGPLDYDGESREPAIAVLVGFMLAAAVAGQIVARDWNASGKLNQPAVALAPNEKAQAAEKAEPVGNTLAVGQELLTRYAVPVELAGVLLLVAMVGAIALARKPVVAEAGVNEPQLPLGEAGRRVKPF